MNREQRRKLPPGVQVSPTPKDLIPALRFLCMGLDNMGCPDRAKIGVVLHGRRGFTLDEVHKKLVEEDWKLALSNDPEGRKVLWHDPLCPKCGALLEARIGLPRDDA